MTKIVLATFGSLGDLHPYIAIGLELRSRGHDVVIATSETYRCNVVSEGLGFAAIRPDLPNADAKPEVMRRIMDRKNGPEFLIRRTVLPFLRDSYEDLLAACDGANAIVGHPLIFAAPLVSRVLGIPWAYVALAPIVFMSVYDPPVISPVPWLKISRKLGPGFFTILFNLVKLKIDPWFDEVRVLSRDLGIYPCHRQPMGADQYSEYLNIALFSTVLGAPQRDWPKNTVATGFVFYDQHSESQNLSPGLEAFLNSGEPPIVFTLGTAAVNDAGSFYVASAAAAKMLGKRAVLLVGKDTRNRPSEPNSDPIYVSDYEPFSKLFPRASVIVHQGGVGTTAQAMRAGKPMLVMPYAFDQPDNAQRVVRLGVGISIDRSKYSADKAAIELDRLLSGRFSERAEALGRLIRMESGCRAVSDAIESHLLPLSV